jgi:hypothetical protein
MSDVEWWNYFPSHVVVSYWIAARSSAASISTIKSNSPTSECPILNCQNVQPFQVQPEDG